MRSESPCLVIYTRSSADVPWVARTQLLGNKQMREILAESSRVYELGAVGTHLRVASFAGKEWNPGVHGRLRDQEFGASRGIPIVPLMNLVRFQDREEEQDRRMPSHLRRRGSDGVIA